MRKCLSVVILSAVAVILAAQGVHAGQYHSMRNNTLICYDCHTMHSSTTQGFSITNPFNDPSGIWIQPEDQPNEFLLKGITPSETCLKCHDGQTFAPDVMAENTNEIYHRSAGALTDAAVEGYEDYKGHSIGSTDDAPGNSGAYVVGDYGLECVSCHLQHGGVGDPYRNLGSWTGPLAGLPTYSISTTQDTSDVWVDLSSYTSGTGNPTTFSQYYEYENIRFSRNEDGSNAIVDVCAQCHTDFHGDVTSDQIGGEIAGSDPVSGANVGQSFLRHPASYVTLRDGANEHSDRSRYVNANTRTRALNNDHENIDSTTEPITPFCLSCHKAHGNQNVFGLFFLSRDAQSVNEEGGYASGQDETIRVGFRNLCGQCHTQGN